MRKSTKNAIVAVIAIVLALAIVIACGVGSSWFTNSDIATWFNSWGKGEQIEQSAEGKQPVDEGSMVIGESQPGGAIALTSMNIPVEKYAEYGISPMAENAQVVTATVNPEEATIKDLVWSVSWNETAENEDGNPYYTEEAWYNDGDGDYATSELAGIGVTEADFIQISPSSDTLSCTVSCSQAFGCPITLTVSSVNNPSITDTCRIDYRCKITDVVINGSDIVLKDTGADSSISYQVFRSAGTIVPAISVNVSTQYEVDFSSMCDDYGVGYDERELSYGHGWLISGGNYIDSTGAVNENTYPTYDTYYNRICTFNTSFEDFVSKYCVGGISSLSATQKKAVLEEVRELFTDSRIVEGFEETAFFKISVNVTNEDTSEKFSETKYIYLTDVSGVSSFIVPVTNVSLNKDTIIF